MKHFSTFLALGALLLASLVGPSQLYATDYYVSVSGNDLATGTSAATAWKSLEKVNTITFQPGDRILLEAGGVWNGELKPLGSGAAGSPILIDSFGSGALPVIHAPGTNGSAAVSLYNQSYWEVSHLEMTNQQAAGGNAQLWGVKVGTNISTGVEHIYILNCYVHDVNAISQESNSNFSKGTGGIIFTGLTNEVLIKGNHVKDVSVEGIRNSCEQKCAHFVIDSNLIENVYGDGIVLHGVKDGSAITRNVIRNVCYNTSGANYAGAWTYLSEGTRIAFNEISGIKGGGGNDGQPFDADISVDGDIFEYNYTHDNYKGFMLFMPSARNVTVRYNISVNDIQDSSNNKRLFNYTVTGNNNNRIYNNIFFIDAPLVTSIFQGGFIGEFSNNIIYATGTVQQFSTKEINPASVFQNNCFYPAAITAVNGPAGMVSGNIFANPGLVNPGYHEPGIDGGVLQAYKLTAASPCRESGVQIPGAPAFDFAGNDISNFLSNAIGAIWPTDLATRVETVFPVKADTYTYDGNAGGNFGGDNQLVAKFGGGYAPEGTPIANGYSRRTYLKFATAGLDAISNINKVLVRVRYFTKDNNYAVNGTKISLSRNAGWDESTITWSNQLTEGGSLDSLGYTLDDGFPKPSSVPSPMTDEFINNSTHYIYLDVTDTILSMLESGTLPSDLSFVLQGICSSISGGSSPVGNTGHTFFSREFTNASGQPVDSLAPALVVYSASGQVAGQGITYYVDPDGGNDAASGKSMAAAWKSLAQVNAQSFVGGDSILLKAGGVFNGVLKPGGSGDFNYPVVISRYGSEADPDPVIDASGVSPVGAAPVAAVQLTDQSYFELRHLDITSEGAVGDVPRYGVLVTSTEPQGQQRHIFISDSKVRGIHSGSAGDVNTGAIAFVGSFDSVQVERSIISDIGEQGIVTMQAVGSTAPLSSSVIIKGNELRGIGGEAIHLGDVSVALVDSNLVAGVDGTEGTLAGAQGTIALTRTLAAVVMHNELRQAGQLPAFYAGSGTRDAIFQYNYTHDNPFGLLKTDAAASGTVYRFNVSQGDGNGQALFTGTGSAHQDHQIYNNTIYLGSGLSTTLFDNPADGDLALQFTNNIVALGGATLTAFATHALNENSVFNNNSYFPAADFQSSAHYAAGQSKVFVSDPGFENPGAGGDGLTGVSGYQLKENALALSYGALVADDGGVDYYGTVTSGRKFWTLGALWPATEPVLDRMVITAEADTYTFDRQKDANFGTDASLVSKFGGGYAPEGTPTANNYSRRTYLKFATDDLKNAVGVQRVYLRMRYYAKDNNYSVNGIKASLTRLTDWDENLLTWNTQLSDAGQLDSIGFVLDDGLPKPAAAPTPVTDAFINASTRYIDIDVTDTIVAMLNGGVMGEHLSMALQGLCSSITGPNGSTPVGNTGFSYFSRDFVNENGQKVDSLQPALVVYSVLTDETTPIRSSALRARVTGEQVWLSWTDYQPLGEGSFFVERSLDGTHFTRLAQLPAKNNGAGLAEISYSYQDKQAPAGHVYYRLQQLDGAGRVLVVSNIVHVQMKGIRQEVRVYPNPVLRGGLLHVKLPASESSLQVNLIDALGRTVLHRTVAATGSAGGELTLSVSGLTAGVYFLSIDGDRAEAPTHVKVLVR